MPENRFEDVIDRRGTYCTQWDFVEDRFGEKDLLPFTISDTDFAVPGAIGEALKKRMEHPVFGYTRWNHEDYKRAITRWFDHYFQIEIKEEWVVYSPSVIYSVATLIDLYSEPGEGIVIQTPAYDAFFKTIRASERKIIENPLLYEEGQYRINFEDLEEALARSDARILLLCSPHNPTGRVWSEADLQRIVNLCRKYDLFLISDEIHMDVRRPWTKHYPVLRYVKDYKKMALVSSASKTFNTPGLGGSYLLLPDEEVRTKFLTLLKNRDGLSSASIFGIESLMAAYKHSDDWLQELNAYIDSNLYFVEDFLKREFPEMKFIIPESTYLAWIDVSALPYTMEELQEALVKVGKVAIMSGDIYGGNGASFLRLNVGCSRFKLEDGLRRLKKSLEYLKEQKPLAEID